MPFPSPSTLRVMEPVPVEVSGRDGLDPGVTIFGGTLARGHERDRVGKTMAHAVERVILGQPLFYPSV